MKALVTGGLGFIGSNFIKSAYLRYPIINLDKMGIGCNPVYLLDLQGKPSYEFIKGDIRDGNLIKSLIKDVDIIINFAAETHVDRSIREPGDFIDNNILGTFSLLEAERKLDHSIRHIQVSTDETYGSSLNEPFKETDPLNPSNPYSATKAASDLLCQSYFKTYGMDILTTRCTNNFGPNQFPEKFIPKTIIRAFYNLKIPIYGTGKNIRDWIYVLDHCSAIDFVSKMGKSGEVYNISSGNEFTNVELVEQILVIMGKSKNLIQFVEDRPGHDLRYSLDSTKLRLMGWRPTHAFEEELRTTVEWYLANSNWWKPISTPDILSESPWKSK
jgi:dTDP-glucose 4,6-dehydratase